MSARRPGITRREDPMRFLRPLVVVIATSLAIATVAVPASAQTGPGANLGAQDTSVLSGPPQNLDAVPATQSISGVRQWQLTLQNFGSSQVTGATIAVHSSGPPLNDGTQFGFSANVFGPFSATPAPPTPVACTVQSATDASCGSATTPL